MKTRYTLTPSESLSVGTAHSQAGQFAYGQFDALTLPSGGVEFLPVIIAQGRQEGPVLWLTAGIHGDEYTGLNVIHRVLSAGILANLKGAIVAVPTLNPAGLRIGKREPYYFPRQDPNRIFPTPPFKDRTGDDNSSRMPLEAAYARLFESIRTTASGLIDLHNYSLNSIPFAFRDPVYYFDEREKEAARQLYNDTDAMIKAFGHTVINEFASESYLKKSLHRSVSGATLLVGRIPSFTVELGGYLNVDPAIVEAAAGGVRNVLRWMGMLASEAEPILGVPVISLGYPVRRIQAAHTSVAGIVRFFVRSGTILKAGDPVAQINDIYGRPLGKQNGIVRVEQDGLVLGLSQGAAFYEGEHLITLAVRDEADPIQRWPY